MNATSNRPVYSCIRCSERKVKCDRQNPCANCKKQNVQCVFRPPRKAQKKQRRLKKEILLDRLQQYEAFIEEQGFDPNAVSHSEISHEPHAQIQTPSSLVSKESPHLAHGQSVPEEERVRLVDNSLMTRVAEEFHAAKEGSADSSNEDSDESEPDEAFDLIIGTSSYGHGRCKHPSVEQIFALWQVYVDNVDPLTKIIHAPSTKSKLERATNDISTVPKSFSALMFAIYGVAIASLKDVDCHSRFGESRSRLLSHYIAATKISLVKADYTVSNNIIVLQALLLHILSIRDSCHPRTMWILTNVAMRIAEGMKLNRDADSLGLPPFETEIRRRVWFYLNMHNNNAAEMCGQQKFQGLDTDINLDTALANVNDNDLFPGMVHSPTSTSTPTDMIFCSVQSEFFVFAKQMTAMNRKQITNSVTDDFASKESIMPNDDVLQRLEDTVETRYLRHCDPSDPLQLMTIVFARYCVNVSHFMAHHPRKWQTREHMPESERKYIWNISIKLFEQLDMMQSSSHLQRFAWNSAYYLQWWALIHIIDCLRADPLMADSEKAWRLVEKTFKNNPALITDTRRSLYVAVGNLCLKAFSARETAMMKARNTTLAVPNFVQQLRRQRNAVKNRTRAKEMPRSKEQGLHQFDKTQNLPDTSAEAGESQSIEYQSVDNALSHRQSRPEQNPDAGANDSGYSWSETPEIAGFGFSSDMLDQNMGLMHVEDEAMGNTDVQAIDWTQWDAWLGGAGFQTVETPWTWDAV